MEAVDKVADYTDHTAYKIRNIANLGCCNRNRHSEVYKAERTVDDTAPAPMMEADRFE